MDMTRKYKTESFTLSMETGKLKTLDKVIHIPLTFTNGKKRVEYYYNLLYSSIDSFTWLSFVTRKDFG